MSSVANALAVNATAPTGAAAASPSTGSDPLANESTFLTLLVSQLQNQDPMNPVSATYFTSQLAQLGTVSGIQQLNTNIQQMLQLQQLSQGAALIGKTVSYIPSGSSTTGQGIVQAISVQNGQLQVQVGNQQVPIGQVNGIVQS